MADWTKYSEPEPDLAPLLSKLPTYAIILEALPQIRKQHEESLRVLQNTTKRLPPADNEHQIRDYKVPVEGAENLVRSYVPTPPDGQGVNQTFPLYVWYHGGAFCLGSIYQDDYTLRKLCVELQISVLNVEYRLAPEYPLPAGMNDAYAALKWAADNAAVLSASLSKGFIVGGESAGAHIAAVVSHWARDDVFFEGRRLTGQVLQVPSVLPSEIPPPERYKHLLRSMEQNKDAPVLSRETLRGIAEILRINSPSSSRFSVVHAPNHRSLPPAVFLVAGGDPLRDEGLLYEMILREAGVTTKLTIYPGMPHSGADMLPGVGVYERRKVDYRDGLKWLISDKLSRVVT